MKNLMFKYFYSLLLAIGLSHSSLYAQSILQPKCLQLGIDVGRIAYYGFIREPSNKLLSYSYTTPSGHITKPTNPKYSGLQYEFTFAIQYKLFIIDVDFGFGSAEWKGKHSKKRSQDLLGRGKSIIQDIESIYKTNGYYTKIGFDINFLTDTPENNAAFIGVRYCLSFFKDSLKTKLAYSSERRANSTNHADSNTVLLRNISENGSDYTQVDTYQPNVRATWLEAIAGVRVKVMGPIFFGCSFRYKFFLKTYNAYKHEPYEILGWGITSDPVDTTVCGYNLYISIGLPVSVDEPYDRKVGKKDKPMGSLL
jgi:hypothetical protein